MNVKELCSKLQDLFSQAEEKAKDLKKSETYDHTVSIFKETWEKLKNKRIRI